MGHIHVGHVHVRYMYVWGGSVNGTCIGFLGNAAANLDNTGMYILSLKLGEEMFYVPSALCPEAF